MKILTTILVVIAAITLSVCVLQERNLATLESRVSSIDNHLSSTTLISDNQGRVLESMILLICKGNVACAQEFIYRSLTPQQQQPPTPDKK